MEEFEALSEENIGLSQTDEAGEELAAEFAAEFAAEDEDNPLGVALQEEKSSENETYTVICNGKEMSLTLEELKSNAQKGLNYDNVKSEYESLKNSPMLKTLEALAGKKQMTKEDFVSYLAGEGERSREEELKGLGISSAEAKRIAKLENSEQQRLAELEQDRPYREFAKRFPEVNPSDIPAKVWQEFEASGDLVLAYMDFENQRLKTEMKMLEQNKLNAKTGIGAAKSGGRANADPFLEGLYS